MARRTTFKIPGLRTWVNNIKNGLSAEAAEAIVTDLKLAGPYWTGEFEANWVVELGDKRIRATEEQTRVPGPVPEPFSGPTPVEIPKPSGRKSITYTIGNRMKYRNVALDLEPGRLKKGTGTADQDWYLNYVKGGGTPSLKNTLKIVTGRVASDSRIKGFKGK